MNAEDWNKKYPPRTPARVRRIDGSHFDTTTATQAFRLGNNYAIFVTGDKRLFGLDAVTPLKQNVEEQPVSAR